MFEKFPLAAASACPNKGLKDCSARLKIAGTLMSERLSE
jgi:hypothetical protein